MIDLIKIVDMYRNSDLTISIWDISRYFCIVLWCVEECKN